MQDVSPDTPAERAGLRAVRRDRRAPTASRIRSDEDLIRYISGRPPGTLASLEVWRDGERAARVRQADASGRSPRRRRDAADARLPTCVRPRSRESGPARLHRPRPRSTPRPRGRRHPRHDRRACSSSTSIPPGPARLAQVRADHVDARDQPPARHVASRITCALVDALKPGEAAALLVYDQLSGQRAASPSIVARSGAMKARILVVDDEPAIRDTMRMILEYEGHEVLTGRIRARKA